MVLEGSYDPVLVTLSVGVAMFAAFTALNVAGRLVKSVGAGRIYWLVAASASLGGGIWAMHFIGMLALQMPMPAVYDLGLTLLSLLLPILVSAAGLYAVSRFGTAPAIILLSGALVGLGIALMHYTGMAGMAMSGLHVSYDPLLVCASVAIAMAAASAALWLAFATRSTGNRIAAAVLMGAAVSGMHYTGMAAAQFTMTAHGLPGDASGIHPGGLALAVAAATSALLLLALITAFFDRKLARLTAREAEALQRSESRYRALIENASDIIMILDAGGTVVYESSSALRILGFDSGRIVGTRLVDLVLPEDVATARRFLNAARETAGEAVSVELGLNDSGGSRRAFEAVGKNLLGEPAVGGIVVNLRDITERQRLMAELELLSETDALTGALNRRGFLKVAGLEYARARRGGQTISVVMIDIDHFKRVNDTFGHAAGDLVLAAVARDIRKQMRETDILARFGGEEFVILMLDGSPDTPQRIVDRLRRAMEAARIATIKGEVSVTGSFGIATVRAERVDFEVALRLADEALYEAKNAGRNCVRMRA